MLHSTAESFVVSYNTSWNALSWDLIEPLVVPLRCILELEPFMQRFVLPFMDPIAEPFLVIPFAEPFRGAILVVP